MLDKSLIPKNGKETLKLIEFNLLSSSRKIEHIVLRKEETTDQEKLLLFEEVSKHLAYLHVLFTVLEEASKIKIDLSEQKECVVKSLELINKITESKLLEGGDIGLIFMNQLGITNLWKSLENQVKK